MRKTWSLLTFGTIFSVLAFGNSWSGKLIDASCYAQQKTVASCGATSETAAFALDVSGKVFNLDATGNSKAASAIKNRADRAADPNNPQSKEVVAKVNGTESGGTITVESIDVQ
jgi:archaellin